MAAYVSRLELPDMLVLYNNNLAQLGRVWRETQICEKYPDRGKFTGFDTFERCMQHFDFMRGRLGHASTCMPTTATISGSSA